MIPVTLFLSLFHVLALGGGVADAQSIVLGVGLVMVGLMALCRFEWNLTS